MWGPTGVAAREEIAPKERRFKVIANLCDVEAIPKLSGHSSADLEGNCKAPLSAAAFFRWRL
jgi:hypothetical protein